MRAIQVLVASAAVAALAASAASAGGGGHAFEVREYAVPAGSHPHDVAPARDGGVWYTEQAAGALGLARPEDGAVAARSARRGLGAARRDRRARRGSVGHRRGTERDRARRPADAGAFAASRSRRTGGRQPEHGDLRRARRALVHGAERRLRPARPEGGAVRVFDAPRGPGPYGITTTPAAPCTTPRSPAATSVGSTSTPGRRRVLRPPTAGQGARRVWADSRGRIWVSEWNAGKLGRYDPATRALARVAAAGPGASAVRDLRRRARHRLAERFRRQRARALRPAHRAIHDDRLPSRRRMSASSSGAPARCGERSRAPTSSSSSARASRRRRSPRRIDRLPEGPCGSRLSRCFLPKVAHPALPTGL